MLISRHCLWVAAVALASAGCSSQTDDLPREPVSGKVTLDGKPLATGMITFTPTGGTEPSRPETVVTALIQDGAYSLPRAQGPI
ncbi:MAG: hypothetical protein IRY99_25890, partial [Isosphaeraceae bacterium]|nr:hypothetical protein [Isosphaeraceae bacterium]